MMRAFTLRNQSQTASQSGDEIVDEHVQTVAGDPSGDGNAAFDGRHAARRS